VEESKAGLGSFLRLFVRANGSRMDIPIMCPQGDVCSAGATSPSSKSLAGVGNKALPAASRHFWRNVRRQGLSLDAKVRIFSRVIGLVINSSTPSVSASRLYC
jgi:hypothetical protein